MVEIVEALEAPLKGGKERKERNEEVKNFAKLYLSWNLSVIPLKRNSKSPTIQWKTFQKKRMSIDEIENYIWENIAIITGKISSIVVIDADTEETVSFLEENFDVFKKTTKVKTRRGIHYYFYIYDYISEISTQKIYKDNIRIDIKADGSYVVAPPSKVNGHEYYWLNLMQDKDTPFVAKLQKEEFLSLLKAIKEKLEIKEDTLLPSSLPTKTKPKEQKDSFFDFVKLDLNLLASLLKKHYAKGNRQNICIFAAGLLLKEGFSEEEILQFFEDFLDEVADEEKNMRLAGVRHTISDFRKGLSIKGKSGLLESGISEEEILKCYEKFKKIEHLLYVVRGDELFYLVQKKKETIRVLVGPYIEVLDVYFDEDQKKYVYVAKMYSKTYTDLPVHKVEEIEKRHQINIPEPKKLEKFIHYSIMEKMKNPGIFLSRCGWHNINGKDYFVTPSYYSYYPDNINIKFDSFRMEDLIPRFKIKEKQKLHELVLAELKKGSILGILFLAAASAPFLKYINTSYSVFLSGPPGAGKTLSCKTVCNLFYDNSKRFNLYTTQVYRERLLYMLSDLPILFDETALDKDEKIEMLLYLVETQKTKGRGNINLAAHSSDRRNVVFITSEHEMDSQRLGIFRRCLFLNLSEEINLDRLKFIVNNKSTGAGYDYVDFFLKNSVNIDIEYQGGFEPARALLFTLNILESFYQTRFDTLRTRLNEIVQEHERRIDFFEFSKNTLLHIYFQNKQNFFDPETNFRYATSREGTIRIPEIPKILWGFRDVKKNILFVFPKILVSELKQHNVDLKSFLSIMKKKGVLITNDREYYKTKLPEPLGIESRLRFYAFDLNALNVDTDQEHDTETQQDSQNSNQVETQGAQKVDETQEKPEEKPKTIYLKSYKEEVIEETIFDALEYTFSGVYKDHDLAKIVDRLRAFIEKFETTTVNIDDLISLVEQQNSEKDFTESWIAEEILNFFRILKEKLAKNELPSKLPKKYSSTKSRVTQIQIMKMSSSMKQKTEYPSR